ncbi:MAG: hypothetical protein IH986_18470 [Planctomycetes bacterium]|nr:hypothetical protein [Planctomycetota bacterium]
MLHFDQILDALGATPSILQHKPSAVELVDRLILDAGRSNAALGKRCGFLQGDPSALLIVEFHGDDAAVVSSRIDALATDSGVMKTSFAASKVLDGERQTDILSEAGRALGKVPPVARFGFADRLDDLLLEDRRNGWPVPDRVAFKLDWAAYLDRQPKRTRHIIEMLGQGHLRKDAAAALRITPPAVSMRMNNAYRAWQSFCGEAAA